MAESTGLSTSSKLGGGTSGRPGMLFDGEETKKGCNRISGICPEKTSVRFAGTATIGGSGRTYSNTPLWILFQHPVEEVSGWSLNLLGHLEDSGFHFEQQNPDVVVIER